VFTCLCLLGAEGEDGGGLAGGETCVRNLRFLTEAEMCGGLSRNWRYAQRISPHLPLPRSLLAMVLMCRDLARTEQ
jgi:hypothetical protein